VAIKAGITTRLVKMEKIRTRAEILSILQLKDKILKIFEETTKDRPDQDSKIFYKISEEEIYTKLLAFKIKAIRLNLRITYILTKISK
jgi:hypothetical protein